jgi:biotin carboxyl carrier protein
MPTKYVATLDGAEHELEVEEVAENTLRIRFGENTFEVDVRRVGPTSFSILVGNRCFDLDVIEEGDELIVASRGATTRVTLFDKARRRANGAGRQPAGGKAEMRAMMPGRVINILIKVGDDVAHLQGVLVLEAMKMENEIKSPKAGKVTEVKVTPGQTVEKGELLAVIE